MPTENHEKARIVIKDLLNLVKKHRNKDKEKIDEILESEQSKIRIPTNIAEINYEELFALSFAYVLEGHYEKFLTSFNFAQKVFNIHKVNGTMEKELIEKYAPHINTINENLEIFYETLRKEDLE